jgi:hypothetical protein
MPIVKLEALGFLALGAVFLVVAYLLAAHYTALMREDPRRTMSTDVLLVMLLGGWSAPAVLAVVLCYLGVVCIAIGGLVLFF